MSEFLLVFSCLVYHKEASLLYVGGSGQNDDGVSVATREGLTAWRILSDSPHYKLVTDYSEDLSKVHVYNTYIGGPMFLPAQLYKRYCMITISV